MDHVTTGIRRILEYPNIYELFEVLVGVRSVRRRYVNEFIRPFPKAKVLDIGCGSGQILPYLPEDVEYFGYDLNSKSIALAKKKYAKRGHFECASVSEATPHPMMGQFDFVLANLVLHHLYDSEAKRLVDSAYAHLRPGGVLVTMDCVYVPNQPKIAKFLISIDRGQQVRTSESYTSLITKPFASIESFVLHDMFKFPYTHFILRAVK